MLDRNSQIAAVNAMDVANFDGVAADLKEIALLPDDVEKLYVMHAEAIDSHLNTPEARGAGALFVLCRKHLVLGATSLFRLYSAQMFRETRAAVEAAGIARVIQIDPHSFKVFREDDGSEAASKLARATFTSKLLFPFSILHLKLLFDFYDIASRLSHTNGLTFSRHLGRDGVSGKTTFNYQDIQKGNYARDLPHQLLWLCLAHVAILISSDVTFSGINADLQKFNQARANVYERIMRFKAVHERRFPDAGPA